MLALLLLLAVFLGGPDACEAQSGARDRYREARLRMVDEELAREGIKNPRVLTAMRHVPRHMFVDALSRPSAYFDQALPIGHKQTISPPFIVAYMTEMLDPQPTDRVLEIGTGSGYQAAVLSGIVKEVYTIEIVEPLGKQAAKVLKDLGYQNVHTLIGDGYKGWPEHAPFDKIIVTCSPEAVPQPLIDQLAEGGRMIVPLGERYEQVFYLFEKNDGKLSKSKLLPALFVPMTGISEDKREIKPDPARPELRNGNFETDADADGVVDSWYYQRQVTWSADAPPEGEHCVVFTNRDAGRGAQMLQGMAVDGSVVAYLQFHLQVKGEDLRFGVRPWERPAIVIHFYDVDRRPVGTEAIGPWTGTFDWRQVSRAVPVPPRTREAVVRIGLNGATGTLRADALEMLPQPR